MSRFLFKANFSGFVAGSSLAGFSLTESLQSGAQGGRSQRIHSVTAFKIAQLQLKYKNTIRNTNTKTNTVAHS